jgi:ABC-type transporter Mla subunit MlaD
VRRSVRRRRARRLLVLVLVVVVIAAAVFVALVVGCTGTTGHGGPSCVWDTAPWAVRELIRGIWAALTGQPETRDLFPF